MMMKNSHPQHTFSIAKTKDGMSAPPILWKAQERDQGFIDFLLET